MLTRWTHFLNRNFDFGSYGERPLSNTGGLIVLLIALVALALFMFLCISEPEHEIQREKSPTNAGLTISRYYVNYSTFVFLVKEEITNEYQGCYCKS